MALTYRASGAFVDANSTTTGAIGLPAGLATGDILMLQCQNRGTSATVTTPAGYTLAGQVRQTAGHQMSVFYKYVTDAGTEAAPSVTQSVSGAIRARLSAFSGGHATTQLDVDAVTDRSVNATTFAAPSITPVSQGAMVCWFFATEDDNTLNAATQGTTAYSSDGTLGNDGSIALVYELQTNAAASGTCSMTQSVNGPDNWTVITVALRPAAVAASNPSRDIGYDSLTYAVEAAFGASPFAPEPTWTDISAYVRAEDGIQVTRGRSTEFSDTQPGSMTLTLDNRTRLFDPDYSSGTYFGQLLPQTRIRLRCRHQSTNYPIFDGYVQGWPQSYAYPREAVVQIQAVDLFSRLATRNLPPTLLALEVLADDPVAYWPLYEDSQTLSGSAADLSGNGRDTGYNGFASIDTFVPGEEGQKAKQATSTGGATLFPFTGAGDAIDTLYAFECWFQADTMTAAASSFLDVYGYSANSWLWVRADAVGTETAEFQFSVVDAVGATVGNLTAPFSLDRPYHLAIVIDSALTTMTAYVNGSPVGTDDISAGTFEGGSGDEVASVQVANATVASFAHLALYSETLSAARVLAHFHAGMNGGALDLAADRLETIADFAGLIDAGLYDDDDLQANTYLGTDPPAGSALSAMQDIVRTEQGRMFASSAGILTVQGRTADMGALTVNSVSQATISDSGSYAYAEVPIDSNSLELMRNAIYVSAGGATVQVVDADSRALYDELEESITAILDDPTAAANLGRSRLRRFADPTSRINQVKLIPRGATDIRYALCLGVELGWRLTVTRTPQGLGSAISKVVTVEGITHTFTGSHMETTLYLVPAQTTATAAPWFTFGTGEFGTEYLLHY